MERAAPASSTIPERPRPGSDAVSTTLCNLPGRLVHLGSTGKTRGTLVANYIILYYTIYYLCSQIRDQQGCALWEPSPQAMRLGSLVLWPG